MSESHSTAQIEYRPIPNFPGYRVSSAATVESCLDKQGRHTDRWKCLTPIMHNSGRLHVNLACGPVGNRQLKLIAVHRLVCLAFHGPCPKGMQCCHSDGNKLNNLPSNLRWDTPRENSKDRDRHGTTARGMRDGRAKLTDENVLEIRALWHGGESSVAIAARFGVCKPVILRAAKGVAWAHLPMPENRRVTNRKPVTPRRAT